MLTLTAQPLTAEAFAPFGDVVELPAYDAAERPNRRFDDLVRIDAGPDGRQGVNYLKGVWHAPIAAPG